MVDIYSQTTKVVVWIGLSNLRVDELFDTVSRFHMSKLQRNSAEGTEKTLDTELDIFQSSLKESPRIRTAIKDLYCRSYWVRA